MIIGRRARDGRSLLRATIGKGDARTNGKLDQLGGATRFGRAGRIIVADEGSVITKTRRRKTDSRNESK